MKNKYGIMRVSPEVLKEYLYIPKNINIFNFRCNNDIISKSGNPFLDIYLEGIHKSLYNVDIEATIPILDLKHQCELQGSRVKIKELSKGVKLIKDLEEE